MSFLLSLLVRIKKNNNDVLNEILNRYILMRDWTIENENVRIVEYAMIILDYIDLRPFVCVLPQSDR